MTDEVREAAAEYLVDSSVEVAAHEELRALLRLLEHCEGFAVAFLEHNVPFEAERLVRELLAELASRDRPGDVLYLEEPTDDLLGAIESFDHLPGRPLFILGFERAIPSDREFPPALTRLNMARDLFRRLDFPIVLVLPEYALTKLAREAPDFWAWRSGVFEIEEEAVPSAEIEMRSEPTDPPIRSSNASAERHASVLQSLLKRSLERGSSALHEQLDLHRRLGSTLRSLYRLEEAREHLEQAARLARQADDEEALAEILTELGQLQVDSGQARQGVDSVRTAVAIRSKIARQNPARHEPELARSLDILSYALSAAGDAIEALAAIRKAVEIRRRLAKESPVRYEPELALSLDNFSTRLSEAGDPEEALAAIREAVGIWRRLTSANLERYEPELALSLNLLSNRLSDLGDREGALATIREAVDLFRRLASSSELLYRAELAGSLNNLSNRLSAAGDLEGATAAIREAVEIRRQLAVSNPARYEPELAQSLFNLALRQRDSRKLGAARESLREAIELLAPCAEKYPESMLSNWFEKMQQAQLAFSETNSTGENPRA